MKRFDRFSIKSRRSTILAILKYDDCFYDDGLRKYDFNEALHVYLKKNGYKTIVFFSKAEGFFSYEMKMLENFFDSDDGIQTNASLQMEEDPFVDELTGLSTLQFENDLKPKENFSQRHLIPKESFWQEQAIGEQDSQIVDMKRGLKSIDNCVIIVDPSINEFSSVVFEQLVSTLKHGKKKRGNHLIVLVPTNMHLDRIPTNMLRSSSVFLADQYFRSQFFDEIYDEKTGTPFYELKDGTCYVVPSPTKTDIRNAFQYWRIVEGKHYKIVWHEIETLCEQLSTSRGNKGVLMTQSVNQWEEIFETVGDVSNKGFKSYGVRKIDDYRTQLSELIGMNAFKKWLVDFENRIKIEKDFSLNNNHIIITGNPGTGKTTVARIISGCLWELGLLSKNMPVEVGGTDLKSDHYGGGPIIVNEKVDEALGGVLFVDEAYGMAHEDDAHGHDPLGRESIDTLNRRLENDGDKFLTIVAGYPKDMDAWMQKNDGLASRFDQKIHLEDYNAIELQNIFMYMLSKEGKHIDEEGKMALSNLTVFIERHKPEKFGNARWVRKIKNQLLKARNQRIVGILDSLSEQEKNTIVFEDFKYLNEVDTCGWHPSISLEQKEGDCSQRLNRMVGLKSVKTKIQRIKRSMEYAQKHPRKNNKKPQMHFCFYGNPGTGKTTVAKLLGEILAEYGVCETNKVVCCDRSTLVAGYTGQTAIKTNEVVDSSFGGILFIDEIYNLTTSEHDDFGKEARDTLLKRLEDDRDKFTAILAGYKKETEEFLSTNSGLKSRITDYIEFEDYTPEELHQIMNNLIIEEDFCINQDGEAKAVAFINETYQYRDSKFGNARWIRTFVEKSIEYMKDRVIEKCIEGDMSTVITKDDIDMAIVEMSKIS